MKKHAILFCKKMLFLGVKEIQKLRSHEVKKLSHYLLFIGVKAYGLTS